MTGEATGQPGPTPEHVIQTRRQLTGTGTERTPPRPRRVSAPSPTPPRPRSPSPPGRSQLDWPDRGRGDPRRLARWHHHGTRLALTALDHPGVVVVLELFPGSCYLGHPGSTAIWRCRCPCGPARRC